MKLIEFLATPAIQMTIEIAINEALRETRALEIRGTVENAAGHFAIVSPE